ncbi:hypothetical protein [Demequina iriomotensis]|uniref:hypothetical protein n=1 Tax=Demequina iriomotensis TaxID=1536641 RepID=UPI0007862A80|nr:hypothetical protein [Demequina iriomotensis]
MPAVDLFVGYDSGEAQLANASIVESVGHIVDVRLHVPVTQKDEWPPNEDTQKKLVKHTRNAFKEALASNIEVTPANWHTDEFITCASPFGEVSGRYVDLVVFDKADTRRRGFTNPMKSGSKLHRAPHQWRIGADAACESLRREANKRFGSGIAGAQVRWRAAAGLRVVDATSEARGRDLRMAMKDSRRTRNYVLVAVSVVALLAIPLFMYATGKLDSVLGTLLLLIAYAAMLGVPIFIGAHSEYVDARDELREVEAQQDLQRTTNAATDHEYLRAQSQYRVSTVELKRYHDQTLRQRAWVYTLGALCVVAGLAIAGIALYAVAVPLKDAEDQQRVIVAVVGLVGGLLTNFVAVIFIRMFSDTVKSSVDLFHQLAATHHGNFANIVAASISDQTTREAALARIAEAMVHLPAQQAPGLTD